MTTIQNKLMDLLSREEIAALAAATWILGFHCIEGKLPSEMLDPLADGMARLAGHLGLSPGDFSILNPDEGGPAVVVKLPEGERRFTPEDLREPMTLIVKRLAEVTGNGGHACNNCGACGKGKGKDAEPEGNAAPSPAWDKRRNWN